MDSDGPRDRTLREAEQAVGNLEDRIRRDWSASSNKDVQDACGVVRLVAKFVVRATKSVEEDDTVSTAVRRDKAFVDAFEIIHLTVTDFDHYLEAIGQAGLKDSLVKKLVGLADELRQALDGALSTFVAVINDRTANDPGLDDIRDNALRVAAEIRGQLKAGEIIQEAERARDETVRLRDETKAAAGDTGAHIFAAHYAEYADRENGVADVLRKIVAALLVVIAVAAFAISLWSYRASVSTELLRLSATIPVAVLAGYLARESSRHRLSARWAGELAIAMKTMPIYTKPRGTSGIALRLALGMRAFARSAGQSTVDGLFDDLPKVLDKLEEVLNRVREATERQTRNQ